MSHSQSESSILYHVVQMDQSESRKSFAPKNRRQGTTEEREKRTTTQEIVQLYLLQEKTLFTCEDMWVTDGLLASDVLSLYKGTKTQSEYHRRTQHNHNQNK